MIRVSTKFPKKSILNLVRVDSRRNLSSSSIKLKTPIYLGTGAVLTATLTFVYAKFDKQFADRLISQFPFMRNYLEEPKANEKTVEKSFIKKNPPKIDPLSLSTKPQITDQKSTKNEKESKIESKPKDDITTKFEFDEKDLKEKIVNIEKKTNQEKEMENEFRGQLKRLLYAFNEFYEEKRILYETETKRKQEIDIKNQLLEEKTAIFDEYEKSFKKLRQMEKLLQIRDQLDKQEKASKKLWILSQTLSNILEHNRSLSEKAVPINIQEKIECISQVMKENFADELLIQIALKSVPENAIKNGVYSEEDLISRFNKVKKMCNQVALVNQDYTNLFGYLKSYAYSFIRPFYQIDLNLSLDPIKIKQIPQAELDGTIEVDPQEWDTYDILERVHYCVQHRNLETAIRYANLLKNEARKVAQDWIRDTREHLELKQALNLVQTKISSISLHQLSFAA